MKNIHVNAGNGYDIFIGNGLLDRAGELCTDVLDAKKKALKNMKIALFTDSNVERLYAERVRKSLEMQSFDVFVYSYEAGELSKNITTVSSFIDFMAERSLGRGDAVAVLGGGVAGDMGGFAASIYMRGIKFIQIPTSLLAAVDSSVGGKTGVDTIVGKNLIGSFWQPSLVLCDTAVFNTLDEGLIMDGLAEVIKTAAICDADFYAELERVAETEPDRKAAFEKLISGDEAESLVGKCVKIKSRVVEADERESGLRRILNFGHTMGHAIEKHAEYKISHGKAVAIGMCMISRAAERHGLGESGIYERLSRLLAKFGYDISYEADNEELCRIAEKDKKAKGGGIGLVYLSEMGRAEVKELPVADLTAFFE